MLGLCVFCQGGQLPASDILKKDSLLRRHIELPDTPKAFILPEQASELRTEVAVTAMVATAAVAAAAADSSSSSSSSSSE